MLVAARDEAIIIIRVEFNRKDWQITQVTKGYCPVLFPVEDLNREGSVHSNADQFVAILRKSKMQHSTLM